MTSNRPAIATSIIPFLVVKNGANALEFYTSAFGVTAVKYNGPDEKLNAKLTIEGAVFYLGEEEPEFNNYSPETIGGSPVRIILTVNDPDTLFSRALAAGAIEICPVTTEESWKIGKLKDPFGHIWEIGCPLDGE